MTVLDLHHNYLSKDGLKLVKNLAKKVITNDQQEGGEDDYYVAIAE